MKDSNKGFTPIIIIILTIILIGIGVYLFSKGNKSNNISENPTSISVQPTTTGEIYTNTEYGFQVTIPNSWKGYKMETLKSNSETIFSFELPTTDKNQLLNKNGYYVIHQIVATPIAQWKEEMKNANPNEPDFCPSLGQNKNYEFCDDQSGPQDFPLDFADSSGYLKGLTEFLNSFKVINQ